MSLQESEKNKLNAEAEYFKALTKDLNSKSMSTSKKWDEKIKKWTSVVLAIVSVWAAIWGLFIPIKSYFLEKESLLKYELNDQMVKLVADLDSSDITVSDRSILLLSYYEKNSLPILFYKLEHIDPIVHKNLLNKLSKTINNIYANNRKETKAIIKNQLDDQVQKLKTKNRIDDFNIYAIYNLFFIIEELPPHKKDTKEFLDFIDRINKNLLSIDKGGKKLTMLFKKINDAKNKLKSKQR